MTNNPGDKLRLQHILEAIREIQEYTLGVDVNSFVNNSMMYNASQRQLEMIGEAANHLSIEIHQVFLKFHGQNYRLEKPFYS